MGKTKRPAHGWAKTPEAAAEALAEVYARVPSTNCQGLCADSCCSFAMTVMEQRNIRHQTGVQLPLAHAGSPCPSLTMLRRCGVYEVRPLICRIWGAVAAMRCGYGCQPEGGFLTDAQAFGLLAEVHEIAGDFEGAEGYRRVALMPPEQVARYMRASQKQRDLEHLAVTGRPGVVWMGAPGRIAKVNPR